MQLLDLQRQFAHEVFHGETTSVASQVLPRGLEPARRLQVYRNNINFTLREGLQDIYTATFALVGEDFFKHLAKCYLSEYPPRSGNICDLGENLPEFITTFEHLSGLPYLSDVSLIDWYSHIAFHSSSARACSISELAAVPQADHASVHLQLHPSVHVLESEFPAFDIWRYATNPDDIQDPPNIKADGQCVMVVRQRDDTNVFCIDKTLHTFVVLLQKDLPLGEAVIRLLESNPSYNLQLGLHRLFSLSTIAEVAVS